MIIKKKKKREGFYGKEAMRKRFCRFCRDKQIVIDYKEIKLLEKFISERGKMQSSRFSGNCAKHQRRLTEAIKRARYLAILSYMGR